MSGNLLPGFVVGIIDVVPKCNVKGGLPKFLVFASQHAVTDHRV